jgi:hypothetical protein
MKHSLKNMIIIGVATLALAAGPIMLPSAASAAHGGGGHGGGGHGGGGHFGGGGHGGSHFAGGRGRGGRFGGGYNAYYGCGPLRLATGGCGGYGYGY